MPFVIHHVGARFGSIPFDIPDLFAPETSVVFFDADEDCVDGLLERTSKTAHGEQVVSACLGNRDGQATFNITINPSASSLLEPSKRSAGFVQPMFGIDWDVYDCARVVERRTVTLTSLDALLAKRPDIPTPDVLSLDTQGGEFDILEGASRTIASSVVGLLIEVEFIDLYEGVRRFGDIASLAERQGFVFCGFQHMIDAQASRQPIGLRTTGFPIAADALFLRNVDHLRSEAPHQLGKLAFASVIFGFLDHAFASIAAIDQSAGGSSSERWSRMIGDLHVAAAGMPKVWLPRFPEVLREGEFSRFSREPDPSQWPSMMDLQGWMREHAGPQAVADAIEGLEQLADTPVEHVLRSHGFGVIADKTNFCRRDQAHKLAQLLRRAGTLT